MSAAATSRSSLGGIHRDQGFSHFTADQSPTVALVVGSLFAAIIGSVSFWGSLVAFAKLQESIPKNVENGARASAKVFQGANVLLLLGAVGAAVSIGLTLACRCGGSCWSWCWPA